MKVVDNGLSGAGQHDWRYLVWEIEGNAAKLLMVTFAHHFACHLFSSHQPSALPGRLTVDTRTIGYSLYLVVTILLLIIQKRNYEKEKIVSIFLAFS